MLKPKLLRDFLTAREPYFRQNAEALEVYASKGSIIATSTPGLSFLYSYELNVLAMDYPNSLDNLTVTILKWVRKHQPSLIFNPDKRERGISFDADILDNNTADILFVMPVTERVIVEETDGEDIVTHLPEPDFNPRKVAA
ncbi:phage tail protein [Morganella morganii]|uniref:Phage tail protein n=1 Tax=Morganella morganii TaxID=582 RepID=A0A433ZYL0_MORMO|nr:phage tail protein [Morganella morganii]RUT67206.1 phage tail protein [Morganella morganii]